MSEDARNIATRRIALINRHGTEMEAVSIDAGTLYELHGSEGLVKRFSAWSTPRGNEDDCHFQILRLIHEAGGTWSKDELVNTFADEFEQKTITNAAWDLANEYGIIKIVDRSPLTYAANTHTGQAYEELVGDGE